MPLVYVTNLILLKASSSIGSIVRVPTYHSGDTAFMRQLSGLREGSGGIFCHWGHPIRREPVPDMRAVLEVDGGAQGWLGCSCSASPQVRVRLGQLYGLIVIIVPNFDDLYT